MKALRRYLNKHALYSPQITEPPHSDLGLVVVVPTCDEPNIEHTLNSLFLCERPVRSVEIIVVVNHAEDAPDRIVRQNLNTFSDVNALAQEQASGNLKIHCIPAADLPRKKAGVGLARKIGMDEAVRRFSSIGNPSGVIACLDADCTVSANYLTAQENHFSQTGAEACSVYFRHDLDAAESKPQRQAIARYELHLRLYINGLKSAGYPHAFHTIGSCMAVTALAYANHGGMNLRQAGEDFYFLSKFMLTGNMSELNDATVYPSPRLSERVPFGTGIKTREWMEHPQSARSYPPSCYTVLSDLVRSIDTFWQGDPEQVSAWLDHFDPIARQYLKAQKFDESVAEIRANTASLPAFRRRFFRWLNPFRTMQLIRRLSDSIGSLPVEFVAGEMSNQTSLNGDVERLLAAYRQADCVTRGAGV